MNNNNNNNNKCSTQTLSHLTLSVQCKEEAHRAEGPCLQNQAALCTQCSGHSEWKLNSPGLPISRPLETYLQARIILAPVPLTDVANGHVQERGPDGVLKGKSEAWTECGTSGPSVPMLRRSFSLSTSSQQEDLDTGSQS